MKKIELRISSAMSLNVMSSSGADEEIEKTIEVEPVDEALGMSDEDFLNANPDDFTEDGSDDEQESDADETEDEQNNDSGDENEDVDTSDSVNQEDDSDNAEDEKSEETETDEEAEDNQPDEDEKTDTPDYEAEFQKLFGEPIKAGGRMTQLRNVEHAKNLIEMGIDYNKKMQGMRPHMQTLKTLEKEGLLEAGKEDRLNLLLEIEKGNKDALKRFIAESEIDVLDLADEEQIEAGRNYKPQNHIVSNQEVEIEEALNSISSSQSYQKTIDVMTKTFDPKSRELISENPRYIVALNQDMETGIYDQVMDAVQYQRDMNLISNGVSDMEAYIKTVQDIAAKNAGSETPTIQPKDTTTNAKPNQRSTRETKRRKVGMGSTKTSPKRKEAQYDPLSMSDEDFMKIEGMNTL